MAKAIAHYTIKDYNRGGDPRYPFFEWEIKDEQGGRLCVGESGHGSYSDCRENMRSVLGHEPMRDFMRGYKLRKARA